MLTWFSEIEDNFRDSSQAVQKPIERIIAVLSDYCNEEVFEVTKGQTVTVRVVDKQTVADVLGFTSRRKNYMREVIENIEFFQVEAKPNSAKVQYDLDKIIIFCLLFFEGREDAKAACLFYLMCNQSNLITSRCEQVKTLIAMLTVISCMIPAELIKTVSKLKLWVIFTIMIPVLLSLLFEYSEFDYRDFVLFWM